MSYITQDQVRAVRLASARPFVVDGLNLKLNIVRLSGAATLEAGEIQAAIGEGKKKTRDLLEFMLANGVADEKGDLLGPEAAVELLDLIPFEAVNAFMESVKTDVAQAAKAAEENPSAASQRSGSRTA